jgi:hypothetical protein
VPRLAGDAVIVRVEIRRITGLASVNGSDARRSRRVAIGVRHAVIGEVCRRTGTSDRQPRIAVFHGVCQRAKARAHVIETQENRKLQASQAASHHDIAHADGIAAVAGWAITAFECCAKAPLQSALSFFGCAADDAVRLDIDPLHDLPATQTTCERL